MNRRVHITEETLQHLNGMYQVEDSNGGSRDPLLHGRKTYLVIDPHKPDISRPKPVRLQSQIYVSVDVSESEFQPNGFQASALTAGESRQRASVRMSQYLQSWRTIRPFADLSNPNATSSMKKAPGSAAIYQSQLSQVSLVRD